MSQINYTIEQRVDHLSPAVDHRIRHELTAVCRMLTQLHYPAGVVTTLSRLSLIYLSIILDASGKDGPRDQLNACIEFCRTTLEPGGRGTLLSGDIVPGLHTIRVLSNKADHASESARITVPEGEAALAIFLRALEWYYTLSPFGPQLSSLTTLPGDVPKHPDPPETPNPAGSPSDDFQIRTKPPKPRNPFVGRESELRTILELLDSEARLLTLTGSGGCGKTRLTIEVAARLDDAREGGVAFAEFASATDASGALSMLKEAIGLHEATDISQVSRHIGPRPLLLVLDNCEHVIEFAANATDHLLRHCPALTVLATSREPLEVEGEVTFRVPSLSVPRTAAKSSERSVLQYDAVRLFASRAKSANPSFAITDANAPAVAELCARLDGIPLAIELAASRARVLTAEQILQRLTDRFALLTTGSRSSLPRHQTLRAAIDWSFQLLQPHEQAVLRRTAVFRGSFNLGAANAVAAFDEVGETGVLDAIDNLVDKSLLAVEHGGDDLRYRYLESVREFGNDELASRSDEAAGSFQRLSGWSLASARDGANALRTSRQLGAMGELRLEEPNHVGFLDWASRRSDTGSALAIASKLWRFWYLSGSSTSGVEWLRRLLSSSEDADAATRADALRALSLLLHSRNELADGLGHCRDAVALARTTGDPRLMASCLGALGLLYHSDGSLDAAEREYEESLSFFEGEANSWGCALIQTNLAEIDLDKNDPASARSHIRLADAIVGSNGDVRGEGYLRLASARASLLEGSPERGEADCARAEASFRSLDHREGLAIVQEVRLLLAVALVQNDHALYCLGKADSYRQSVRSRRTAIEDARILSVMEPAGIGIGIDEESRPAYLRGYADAVED